MVALVAPTSMGHMERVVHGGQHLAVSWLLTDCLLCQCAGRKLLQNDDDGTDGGRKLLQNDDDGTDGGRRLLQNDDDGTDGGRKLLQNDDDGTDGGRKLLRA